MELEEFHKLIEMCDPLDLARSFLYQDSVHAISSSSEYARFLDGIRRDYVDNEHISIAGSGNWKYSLNPQKGLFREFSDKSDVDVVVVSKRYFEDIWEELREFHRNFFYTLDNYAKTQLRRHGEDVYCGFITPKWIPNRRAKSRLAYEINTSKYSNVYVGYRTVNMMFFKNEKDTLDYYIRGFRQARAKVKTWNTM